MVVATRAGQASRGGERLGQAGQGEGGHHGELAAGDPVCPDDTSSQEGDYHGVQWEQ